MKTLGLTVGHDNQIWQSVHAQFPNSISRLFPGMESFCSRLVVRFVLRCLFFVFFFRNMEDLDTSISQMNKESLLNWLKEKFNDDIASKFEGKSYWSTKLNFSAK